MKKTLKKFEYFINGLPLKLYLFKIGYSEKNAIKKKISLYDCVQWSESRQKEFDDFWVENYGKKIKPYWNKLYESINGVYHYDYFPEILYSTELEPLLNPAEYCKVFSDKSITEIVYGKAQGVSFPKTLLVKCNGSYLDSERSILCYDDAIQSILNAGVCLIKPTVETGSGKGVKFLNIVNGKDIESGEKIKQVLNNYKKNFIIQQIVKNSNALNELYPDSLNTFRIITFIVNGRINTAPVSLRIGAGNNKVDNIHKGGLVVGVNFDGTLKKYAYQLGYGDNSAKFSEHPDTGVVFDNYYVGNIQQMISVAVKLHEITPQLGIISWDLTFDENDNVVLIEANCKEQSVWFPQIINECPLFGEDTQYMINKIRH